MARRSHAEGHTKPGCKLLVELVKALLSAFDTASRSWRDSGSKTARYRAESVPVNWTAQQLSLEQGPTGGLREIKTGGFWTRRV